MPTPYVDRVWLGNAAHRTNETSYAAARGLAKRGRRDILIGSVIYHGFPFSPTGKILDLTPTRATRATPAPHEIMPKSHCALPFSQQPFPSLQWPYSHSCSHSSQHALGLRLADPRQ